MDPVCWKLATTDTKIASVRYRCIIPSFYMAKEGVRNHYYAGGEEVDLIEAVSAIVFVKTFSDHDLEVALKARKLGIPVYIDICDNLEEASKILIKTGDCRGERANLHAINLRKMAEIATAIVTPSAELAREIQSFLKVERVVVIPDALEGDEEEDFIRTFWLKHRLNWMFGHSFHHFLVAVLPKIFRYIFSKIRYLGQSAQTTSLKNATQEPSVDFLQQQLSANRSAKQILWFGHSGYENVSGITDLLLVKEDLEALAKEMDFHLLVISNDYQMYQKHIKPFRIKTFYLPWSPRILNEELKRSDTVIIPNPMNSISRVKSANRTILSLANGVPVVATATDALRDFDNCIISDFKRGLRSYLSDSASKRDHIILGKQIIEEKYRGRSVAKAWIDLIGIKGSF